MLIVPSCDVAPIEPSANFDPADTTGSVLPEHVLHVRAGSLPLRMISSTRGPATRLEMECFVRSGFNESFGANVTEFMPELLGAFDPEDELAAVIGIRPALGYELFLEQYLGEPIECALERHLGIQVSRDRILEAGNLVAHPPKHAVAFFQAFLLWVTTRMGCDWLVFTGTRAVRALLRRLGAQLHELGDADATFLGDRGRAWGSYYRHQPRVTALELPALLPLLDRTLFDRQQLRRWIEHSLGARR